MTQWRRALTRLPTRLAATVWRRCSFCAAWRRNPCSIVCRTVCRTIQSDCCTKGLLTWSCIVGGSSSPNHMSAARCGVKNCVQCIGHHLSASSDTTFSVVMKDRIA